MFLFDPSSPWLATRRDFEADPQWPSVIVASIGSFEVCVCAAALFDRRCLCRRYEKPRRHLRRPRRRPFGRSTMRCLTGFRLFELHGDLHAMSASECAVLGVWIEHCDVRGLSARLWCSQPDLGDRRRQGAREWRLAGGLASVAHCLAMRRAARRRWQHDATLAPLALVYPSTVLPPVDNNSTFHGGRGRALKTRPHEQARIRSPLRSCTLSSWSR